MAPSTTSPAGRSTGARYREGAFLRNLLGRVAPFSGIIHVYFFLWGVPSQAANSGHFPFRTVRCNAASWLLINRGGVGAARGLVLLPGCPSSGDYRRRLLPRARPGRLLQQQVLQARAGARPESAARPPARGIHLHVHGGAWRSLTRADAGMAAPALVYDAHLRSLDAAPPSVKTVAWTPLLAAMPPLAPFAPLAAAADATDDAAAAKNVESAATPPTPLLFVASGHGEASVALALAFTPAQLAILPIPRGLDVQKIIRRYDARQRCAVGPNAFASALMASDCPPHQVRRGLECFRERSDGL